MKSKKARTQICTAGILASTAVLLGAFGAHSLKTRLTPEDLQIFEVGVRYQMYHALALLFVGVLSEIDPLKSFTVPARLFLLGTLIFSGSLYLLVLTQTRWLGAVTPVGGIFFILGWIGLVVQILKDPARH